MNANDIQSLSDFDQARKQIKSDIELNSQKLDMEVAKLKYQMMPTTMIQSVLTRISDKILLWVDSKL